MHWTFPNLLVGLAAMTSAGSASASAPLQLSLWQTLPRSAALPGDGKTGRVTHDGASIWYQSFGEGPCVVLLHPGLANSSFWGDQVAALRRSKREVILIDSRGHGRSTMGGEPLGYAAMARDVVRVLDVMHRQRCAIVGWSDGAITALVLAMDAPDRVSRVFAFGANMDLDGVDPQGDHSATFQRYGQLTAESYRQVSPTPDGYPALEAAVKAMWNAEPRYTASQLARITVPVAIVDGAHDEVIRRSHTEYLEHTIPKAALVLFANLSHFAPVQDSKRFNREVLAFLDAEDR